MEQLPESITITIVFAIFLVFVVAGAVLAMFAWQKRKAKCQIEKERQILQSRLETQEQTLREVSQEIHDNIGQVLTLIKININTIDIKMPDAAKEKLASSKLLLTNAIQDLRNLSKSLITDCIIEMGLEGAMQEQLRLLQKTGYYVTQLVIKGCVYKLPSQKELVVFRTVQESLNNIVKHAEATTINILMDYQTEKLIIAVQDNGKGFDAQSRQLSQSNGQGLKNMHNRIKLINGLISFHSQEPAGTTVKIILPNKLVPV